MRSRCCLCVCVSTRIVARQRLGKNSLIVAGQLLGKNPLIVATQRLDRNVTAVTNTHATVEELLDASFSMWPLSYQGKWAISSSQNVLSVEGWRSRNVANLYSIRNIFLPNFFT
jgi:hypothetical protein